MPISYKDDIINWLEKCVSIATRYPMVRETIIQYINHLKQLTNQDMDTKNKEEIVEVLSKIENLRAAKAICLNYSAAFDTLAKKYFNPKMDEFAKGKGLEYYYIGSDEAYIRFRLFNPNWQKKCWIEFYFEGNRYYYGIVHDPEIYIMSNENKQILHNKLNATCKDNDWWAFFTYYPNFTVDNWENDIIKESNFFNDCKEKIETLLDAMEGIDL